MTTDDAGRNHYHGEGFASRVWPLETNGVALFLVAYGRGDA